MGAIRRRRKETLPLQELRRISGTLSMAVHPKGDRYIVFLCDQAPLGGIAPWDLPESGEKASVAPSREAL